MQRLSFVFSLSWICFSFLTFSSNLFLALFLDRADAGDAVPSLSHYDDSWLLDSDNKDKMTSFPGWTHRQPLPSPWYSGYLEYELEGRTIHTHYVLVLAEETPNDNVQDKPLLYWSNGGPGAPSLFGLMAELGPLLFSEVSTTTQDYRDTGIPTPQYNPFSWSKLGHILVFDQPAPVGFSYCTMDKNATSAPSAGEDNDEDDPANCAGLGWTDELAATNAFTVLQAFYHKYPIFLDKDLFLTGESYAGIYIPTLARTILQHNSQDDDEAMPNLPLRGFAVGDGCLGTDTGICQILDDDHDAAFDFWLVLFLAGHNQVPLKTFWQVMKACKPYDGFQYQDSDICRAAVQKVHKEAGFVYDYGLYDDCTYSNGMMRRKWREYKLRQHGLDTVSAMDGVSGALNDYACGGDVVMEEYLNLDVVRDAFHIPDDVDYFSADNANGFDYTPTEKDLTGFYIEAAQQYPNLTILVYNGDTDPAITSFATQNWTSHLGLHVEQDWRPWTVDGCKRMGGYVTRYEGKLDFLTIRGAGHLVPVYKAAASFTFVSAWLQGRDYPVYVPNCTGPALEEEDEIQTDGREEEVATQYVRVTA